jgi:hypothetical protein
VVDDKLIGQPNSRPLSVIGKRVERNTANRLYLTSEESPFDTSRSSAAPKCSNQADLHLTFVYPILRTYRRGAVSF